MAKKKTKPKTAGRVTTRRPIADKLIKKMRSYVGAKVVDLSAVMEGKKNAEELQKTVASRESLAGYHPAHAFYIYAQNQTSVMAEQLTSLPEMDRFTRLDACVGLEQETLGTITMAVGRAFGMHEELIRVIGLMQDSRMAVYVHEGTDGDRVRLREMVTDRVCKAICPSCRADQGCTRT